MAKRELSSTLRNLKFMQRVAQREEKPKEEEVVAPSGNFPSLNKTKKCVVIIEGDPHPGATKGRMSFQSFNPSIDKLNEEAANLHQPEGSATYSANQGIRMSNRENWSAQNEPESLKLDSSNIDANGGLKRKQADVPEKQHSIKLQKNVQGGEDSSSDSRSSHKQPKREKLDWNVLRPPKSRSKRE